jgi:hypothetical protein
MSAPCASPIRCATCTRAARAAGRHLCRPAVHHDRAQQEAPAGDLHHLPGARSVRRTPRKSSRPRLRDAVARFKPKRIAGRRILHSRADPGRSWRTGQDAGFERSGSAPGNAVLSEEGKLGGCRDLLPAGPGVCRRRRQARNGPEQASCNILGPTSLGFRNRDDIVEVVRLVESLGIRINTVAPLGASPADLARIPQAHFNIVLYPEIADTAARWLKRQFGQEMVTTVPIGVGATRDFVTEVAKVGGRFAPPELFETGAERLSWYSRLDRFQLSDRQTGVRLRRRHPRHRRGPDRIRTNSASRSAGLAPIRVSLPAMCARRQRNTASSL